MTTVEAWYHFAKGPLFRLAFIIMVLGLIRHVLFAILGIIDAVRKAADKNVKYGKIIQETFSWIFPLHRLHRSRPFMSYVSFIFHIGVIIVPLLLLDHVHLLKESIGFGWPYVSRHVADMLTVLTILSCLILLFTRILSSTSRFLSGFMDYALLLILLGIFLTGFVASHPPFNNVYYTIMLIHFLLADILFILVPFTKLSHCVLYPLIRVSSYVAWKFPPRAALEVAETIHGDEDRPV